MKRTWEIEDYDGGVLVIEDTENEVILLTSDKLTIDGSVFKHVMKALEEVGRVTGWEKKNP